MHNYLWQIKKIILSVFGHKTIGARALVISEDKVLLVKHSYTPGWYTIGGAVEKGETPVEAVQRELFEEVGVKCLTLPKLFSVYHNHREKRDDYVVFYLVDQFEKEFVSSAEILEAQWFELQALPHDISPATQRRIDEYIGKRKVDKRW